MQLPAASHLAALGLAAGELVGFVILRRHFNHNDFAHVISLISLWLLYRAGLLAGAGGAG